MVKSRLNKILALRNISPAQLIELTGVKKSVAYNKEDRIQDIKAEDLSQIVNGLKLSKDEVYEIVTGKTPPESSFDNTKTLELQIFDKLISSVVSAMEVMRNDLKSEIRDLKEKIEELEGGKSIVRSAIRKHPATEQP